MYAPINGSQNNPKAKLYKLFISDKEQAKEKVEISHKNTDDNSKTSANAFELELFGSEDEEKEKTDIVNYQKNTYVCYHTFSWVEATGYGEEEYQPIKGLITHTASMTIKMNAPYFRRLGDARIPDHGDIVKLHGELWIIEDGIQRERLKSLKNLATYYLPLKRLM